MERRLAAILAADVVGYSRLMGEDEAGTLAALKAHREELIEPKIAEHKGRIVKLMGDGVLAEFPSAVEAVQFAIQMQHTMAERNADVPEAPRITYRIGINIGDIIVEGDDIYGDGVNVAARLESLAEPGGICIRRNVRNQVRDKLDIDFEDLGEIEVKNIARPVRTFRVVLDAKSAALVTPIVQLSTKPKLRSRLVAVAGMVALLVAAGGALWWQPWAPDVEPAAFERMAFPLPDKPSIAVLPFDNLSGDPEQEYFADGMTEDLITDLSKISGLFVIARNSSFSYKGQSIAVRQVAEELGVRYVLEGSVRRAGDQVRINAQLIDALTGGHLWAERYDGSSSDIFALQDEVTGKIVTALAVNMTEDEATQQAERQTDSLGAHDAFLQGWAHFRQFTRPDFRKALEFFEHAIELDPNYSRAHAAIAGLHILALNKGWQHRLLWCDAHAMIEQHLQAAFKHPVALAHRFASGFQTLRSLHGEAIAEAKRAIALDPNDAESYAALGSALIFAGHAEDAIKAYQTAMRLDPLYPARYLDRIGVAYFHAEQFESAVESIERARKLNPELSAWHLAAAYGLLDREDDAKAALKDYFEVRNWDPGSRTADGVVSFYSFKNRADAARLGKGLIRAGLCCEDRLESYLTKEPRQNVLFMKTPDIPETYETPEAETLLTESEIRDLVVGNTFASESDGTAWSNYYQPDGTIQEIWGGKRFCGYWAVSGPVMCFGWGSQSYCRTLSLDGSTLKHFKVDGRPRGEGELLQGNPENM